MQTKSFKKSYKNLLFLKSLNNSNISNLKKRGKCKFLIPLKIRANNSLPFSSFHSLLIWIIYRAGDKVTSSPGDLNYESPASVKLIGDYKKEKNEVGDSNEF